MVPQQTSEEHASSAVSFDATELVAANEDDDGYAGGYAVGYGDDAGYGEEGGYAGGYAHDDDGES